MSSPMPSPTTFGPRRPSIVKRKPAPKLSKEELASLYHSSSSSSLTGSETRYCNINADSLPSSPIPFGSPYSMTSLSEASEYFQSDVTASSTSDLTSRDEPSDINFSNFSISSSSKSPLVSVVPVNSKTVLIPQDVQDDCGCGAYHADGDEEEEDGEETDREHEPIPAEIFSLSKGTAATQQTARSVRLSEFDWMARSQDELCISLSQSKQSSGMTPQLGGLEEVDEDVSPRSSFSSSTHETTGSDSASIFDTYGTQRTFDRHGSTSSASSSSSSDSTASVAERKRAAAEKLERMLGESPTESKSPNNFSSVMLELRNTFGKSAHATAAKEKLDRKNSFSVFAKPGVDALRAAADSTVISEDGTEIRFGDMWEGQRTIVCFIRHYWCPSCQDYMASIMKVTPQQLRQLNLKLVVVGCGSPKMIAGYRKMLGDCPYDIVSDPSRSIYRLFGMTRTSFAQGKRSSYVQHGVAANTIISLKRNMAMPIGNPGSLAGLGGEFVVGPGLECTYAHRMKTTRDHAEIGDILKAIGVMVPRSFSVDLTPTRRPSVMRPVTLRSKSSPNVRRPAIQVMDNPNLRDSTIQQVA